MDKLAALNAFIQVVRDGSFAAAARSLGHSRSQNNRLVIGLEDSLGVSLLTRSTRSLKRWCERRRPKVSSRRIRVS